MNLLHLLKKLPVAKWIKPVWKYILKQGVLRCGDWLQEEVKKELAKGLDKAVPGIQKLVDAWQEKVAGVIKESPLPSFLEAKVILQINAPVDKLQADLAAAIDQNSMGTVNSAIDRAFDAFQASLVARIDSL